MERLICVLLLLTVSGCDWNEPPPPAISPAVERMLDRYDAWLFKLAVPESVAPGGMNCGPRICPVDEPSTGVAY